MIKRRTKQLCHNEQLAKIPLNGNAIIHRTNYCGQSLMYRFRERRRQVLFSTENGMFATAERILGWLTRCILIPKIHFIKALLIPDFPSGSSINYHDGKFYVIGDDSRNVLVMNRNYEIVDSIHLFDHSEKRIPKPDKIDLEGSTIVTIDGKSHLLIVGSASRENRKRIILIPLSKDGLEATTLQHSVHKTKDFVKRIKSNGIEEINIEGVTVVNNNLVLGNRSNRAQQQNHLVITDTYFWERQDHAKLTIKKLLTPTKYSSDMLGVSELCYVKELDILLITFTSENTSNSYDDGEIGDSYIGFIKNASAKLSSNVIMVDHLTNLGKVNDVLRNEKVEGVCADVVSGNEVTLHLVSDNDKGESKVFQVKIET